ncbi:MAG: hypothetical protein RL355_581 [Actinomycetota bacterium]|jgi:KDO2-lipid IV(A) lauroyltransferase
MKITSRLVDFGFWAGWNVLWLLPSGVTAKLFDGAAIFAWRKHGNGIKQLELNLSRVTGLDPFGDQIRQLSKKTMRSYLRYYCETFAMARWSVEEISKRVRVINAKPVLDASKNGGVILTLPHSGNWDLAGAWAAQYFGSMCTVAERLSPEGVYQKFLKLRSSLGITIKPLTGEGGTYEFLRSNVLAGKVVALIGDRDLSGSGMTNDFFGHRATLPIGAAVLALDTKKPLFTCSTWFDDEQLVIEFDELIEVTSAEVTGRERLRQAQEITAQIAKRFEKHISAHPENWHQLQPIWNDLTVANNQKFVA